MKPLMYFGPQPTHMMMMMIHHRYLIPGGARTGWRVWFGPLFHLIATPYQICTVFHQILCGVAIFLGFPMVQCGFLHYIGLGLMWLTMDNIAHGETDLFTFLLLRGVIDSLFQSLLELRVWWPCWVCLVYTRFQVRAQHPITSIGGLACHGVCLAIQ